MIENILLGLILIAVNIAISLFIRYLDRNNNSLEKVRRYADKVLSDFNEYVKDKTGELKNVATELEMAKHEGKILVSRLSSLATDFVSKAQGLEGRMQAIKDLEVHIAKSEGEMQKLMNMAELAEKNIEQIRREVGFVDSLAKKINYAKDELETINQTIPEMQKHFTNIAHEELENYKDKILGDVDSSIRAIEERLALAKEESNALLDDSSKKLEELYGKAFEDARAKSNSLEGDAFAKLQKNAEERMADTRMLFDQRLKQSEAEINIKIEDLAHSADEFKKEWSNKINNYATLMTNDLSNTEIALNEHIAQIKSFSENSNTEIKQNMSKSIQNVKDEMTSFSANVLRDIENIKMQTKNDVAETKSFLEQFKIEWNGELSNYKNSLSGDFANLELLLKSRVEEIKSIEKKFSFELKEYVETNSKNIKDEMIQLDNLLHEDIAKERSYIDAFKSEWEVKITDFIEKIKSDFAQTEGDINVKSSLLIQKMNEAEKALHETAKYLESEFKNGEKNSSEELKAMLVRLHKDIAETSEEADRRIAEFKVELDQRFQKFESLIAGTDVMQSELEKAMEGTKEKIKEEFAQHVAILKMEQQTFAKNFGSETDKFNMRLNDIDSSIELLKTKSFDNVSQKLGAFEKEFFTSLAKRSDEMNQSFESLRADIKEKLQLMLAEKEAERREVEDAYKVELKDRVGKLEEEYKGQFLGLDQKVQDIENNLSKRLSDSDDSITKYAQNLKDEIGIALEKARQYMDKELTDYKIGLKDSLSTHYFELEGSAKELRELLDNTKMNATVEFEAIKKDFEVWKSSIDQKFDTSRSSFEDKIARVESVTSDAMEGLKAKYDDQYGQLLAKNDELFIDVKNRVAELNDQVLIAQSQFKQNATEFENMIDQRLEGALNSIDRKVLEANADTTGAIENVKSMIHTLRANLSEVQEKTTLKIQLDAERLSGIIEEIDKKQNAFIAQTQVFEKADQLKLELEKSIEKLKGEVSHFDVYKRAMEEINNQYNRVCKIEGEIEEKISSILAERGRIEKVELRFSHLDDISSGIDRKIDSLKNIGDNIQSYEVQVRKVEESIEKVNARYERLEKKEVVLDQTAESIGRAFEELKALENEIRAFKAEISQMPDDIETLKNNMQALIFNKDKADTVFATLNSLDDMLQKMEGKISQLQDSRSWLASVETRLTDLSTRADEKLKLLSALYKGEPSGRKERGAPSLSTRESVISLHRQGWKVDEIANALELSRGEVDLIIEHSDRML